MRRSIFLCLCLIPIISHAQDNLLYEPLNYIQSVENGTRSRDGKPGPEYWQNHSDYNISVKLDTSEKKIVGSETITYYNDSPATLRTVVIRLYQDRYKKGAIRDIAIDEGDIHDGVMLDTIFINDTTIVVPGNDRRVVPFGTNLLIVLGNPLLPGDRLQLKCKWNFRISTRPEDRRTGYFKDNTWFIGYFYPQIAVYDDQENYFNLKGWDLRLFHKGVQEYYNDFNNYNVRIEVPEDYFVWATGDLTNPEEVYSEAFLDKLNDARSSDTVVHLLAGEGIEKEHVTGHIWQFQASGVPDFAFGTSPQCIWDATSIQIGDRRVSVDAVYLPESGYFPMVIDVARKTIDYASHVYPGIPYPWDHITVFNGKDGGGMEFPMMANDSEFPDSTATTYVTFHEIFHNYTPFMTGLNEKRYPFMDEGLTDFFTSRFMLDQYGKNFGFAPRSNSRIDDYNFFVRSEDGPIIASYAMADMVDVSYYDYVKPSVAYYLFYEMVGAENFQKGFREFAARWKGKHPVPYDFFYTMNDVLNDDFNWFWDAWFFSYGYPDLALELTGSDSVLVRRVGRGSLPLPVKLHIQYSDGTEKVVDRSMEVWKNGAGSIEIKLDRFEDIKEISLDTETVPDINPKNNSIVMN